MLRVLLTGSSGFIGQALYQRLASSGYEVIALSSKDGDIADRNTVRHLHQQKISHVFHLAAKTFVPDSWEMPGEFFRVNVNGTLQLLELCRLKQIGLTFVSAYVYGNPSRLPIKENAPIHPNNPYAHSKYLAEQLCEYYAKNFGVTVGIIRPFNVYGRGQNDKFLIPHIIRQAFYNDNIVVKDINPKRDYVYINDFLDAVILSSNYDKGFSIFNIGSGSSVSVGQVICSVQQLLGINKKVISENSVRHNEINDVVADISKARQELKWAPKYSMESGLAEMIKYMRESEYIDKKHTN